MRLSIVLASSALLGVVGCKVDAPVTPIDESGAPVKKVCDPATTPCYTVDAGCHVVPDLAACAASPTDEQRGLCQGNKKWCPVAGGTCLDDPNNYRSSPELCDDLDNNCDGVVDEGCDKDGDRHCAGDRLVIGRPLVCPESLAGRGDDCDDGDPNNWKSCATCVDADGDSNYTGCDAYHTINTGTHLPDCDDANPDVWGSCATCVDADGDGAYAGCDAYTLHPGPDCDDADPRRSPMFKEVCFNNIDDNCGATPTDPSIDEGCPPVAVSIARTLADLTLHPGGTASLALGYFKAQPGSNPSLKITVSAVNNCDAAGVVATLGSSNASLDLKAGVNPGLHGCTYHVSIANDGGFVFDEVNVAVVDDPPTMLRVARGTYDAGTGHWRVVVADGIAATLTAFVADTDTPTTALSATWSDPGKLVSPTASTVSSGGATSTTLTLLGVASEAVTLQVSDGARSSAAVIIDVVVEPCVFVSSSVAGRTDVGVGAGDTPATPMATLVPNALERAWIESKNVCFVGDCQFGSVILNPSAHPGLRTPSLLGGFVDPASPSTTPVQKLSASSNSVVSIGPGYKGTVAGLDIDGTAAATSAVWVQASAAAPAGGGVSAAILDCRLSLESLTGTEGRAVLYVNSGYVLGGTAGGTIDVTLSGGTVTALASPVNTVGALVSGPTATLKIVGLDAVTAPGASLAVSGTATSLRGVATASGASLWVRQVPSITVTSSTPTSALAVGIDIAAMSAPAKVVITGNGDIRASCPADLAAGIRMAQAYDVTIADNDVIAVDGPPPRSVGAGIADLGAGILAGGMPSTGSSSQVKIRGNRAIVNLAKPTGCGTGTLVPAGILLAGTTGAVISDNGRTASSELHYGGIIGGAATAAQVGGYTPGPVGLWLINATGAQVTNNEIRAGYFDGSCSITGATSSWIAVGYRESTSGAAVGLTGALVDRNGILCAPALQASASATAAGCSAVFVDNPTLGNGPLLTNNIVGGNYGDPLIGLAVRGGSGTRVYNNAFDVGDDNASGQGTRWAVHIDRIAAGGVALGNNLLVVRGGVGSGALAYHETVETGSSSSLASMQNNVMQIAGDPMTSPDTPTYAIVATPANTSASPYPPSKLNLVAGVGTIGGNLAAQPLLISLPDQSQRTRERLSPYSPARHAGIVVNGVPLVDIDGQVRPGATTLTTGPAPVVINGPNPAGVVDVGPDEYVP